MHGAEINRTLVFHWKSDNSLAKKLELVKPLRYGFLYKQKNQNQYWYLDGDQEYMHRVRNNEYDLLIEWNNKEIKLTHAQINTLSIIGATEADNYGNRRGKIKIPVSADLNSGKTIDPCLIQISKEPPLTINEKQVILGDKVKEFGTTAFALPPDVRIASYRANELRMGFAPTLIETKDGKHFILNWSNDIFHYGEIKGQDILLPDRKYEFDMKGPILVKNDMKICIVHFDWYEGCESLLLSPG